jgi:hypothetical protein
MACRSRLMHFGTYQISSFNIMIKRLFQILRGSFCNGHGFETPVREQDGFVGLEGQDPLLSSCNLV